MKLTASILDNTGPSLNAFEELYIDVRDKEKRVLSDGEVMFLPDVDATNINYKEWQIRKRSSQKLIAYLKKKHRPLRILEIGCGNGWLSAALSTILGSKVTGLDINTIELNQANRVFKKQNLEFLYGYFEPAMFGDARFDIIVFAASIQYFPSLKNILQSVLKSLAKNGEVHIIDSNFYKPAEVEQAANRTRFYYQSLGYPQMADYYFHHTLTDLQGFNYEVLFNPTGIFNRRNKKAPFYWFCISQ